MEMFSGGRPSARWETSWPWSRKYFKNIELENQAYLEASGKNEMVDESLNKRQDSYSYEELLSCGRGELFGPGNAQLPLPPMLMFNRITEITKEGGKHGKGKVIAEFEVRDDLWFFDCHFQSDPVMPGCLGLDALWQMTGFFLGWLGAEGRGRALGVGEVKLKGMVTPSVKEIVYEVDLKRVVNRKLVMGVADGEIYADGELVYEVSDMKVGLFRSG